MLTFITAGPKSTITATDRSFPTYVPALSTICINIVGVATVKVISNPFNDIAKDFVLFTLTATTHLVLDSATAIIVDITTSSGTVDITVTPNGRPFTI